MARFQTQTIQIPVPADPLWRRLLRKVLSGDEKKTRRQSRWAWWRANWRGWVPFAVLIGLVLTAGMFSASPRGAGSAVLVDLVVGGAVASRIWVRHRQHVTGHRKAMPRRNRIWMLTSYSTGAAWLLAASIVGPFAIAMPALLIVGWVPCATAWWAHRLMGRGTRIKIPHQVEIWRTKVGNEKGPLPASAMMLDTVTVEDGALTAEIDLSEGELPAKEAINRVDKVALKFKLPVSSVTLRQTPAGDSHRILLSIYERNPLREKLPWPGPDVSSGVPIFPPELFDPETGLAAIGRYMSGDLVPYRFWRYPDGPRHDLLTGMTGGGKSKLLGLLLAYERYCELLASWVADPQDGMSASAWKDGVSRFAQGPDECGEMLSDVRDLISDRQKRLSTLEWVDKRGRERTGVEFLTPSPEMPYLVLTLEEWTMLKDYFKGIDKLVEQFVRIARKVGIKIRITTQDQFLDQLGSQTLRNQVKGGNYLMFRAGSSQGAAVTGATRLGIDPSTIPERWHDGAETTGVFYRYDEWRAELARAFLVGDDEGEYDHVIWGGPEFTTHVESLWVPPSVRRASRAETEGQGGQVITLAKPDSGQLDMDNLGDDVTFTLIERVRRCVLRHQGLVATNVIIAELGLRSSDGGVSQALARLVDRGEIKQERRGIYGPPAGGAVVDREDPDEEEAL